MIESPSPSAVVVCDHASRPTYDSRCLPETPTHNLTICLEGEGAVEYLMPELTRRRYPERHDFRHIYYGDVHVGTLAKRPGNPNDSDPRGWRCGFYSGSQPGDCRGGTAASLERNPAIARATILGKPVPLFIANQKAKERVMAGHLLGAT
jgi:hypothetical protein